MCPFDIVLYTTCRGTDLTLTLPGTAAGVGGSLTVTAV